MEKDLKSIINTFPPSTLTSLSKVIEDNQPLITTAITIAALIIWNRK